MKGFIFFLLFTYINVAHAEGDPKESKCNFFGLQAEMIMEYRQDGVNMGDVIEKFPSDKELVVSAYERPRFNTEENKRKSIQDFTNETILKCYKE
jgi:hypothetical protein